MLRVLCVRWGDKYGPEYTERLRRAVERYLKVPHEFVEVRDNPPSTLPVCWQKVGLFRPGAFPGMNLYLDLDIVIHSDITWILDEYEPGRVTMIDDFRHGYRHPWAGTSEKTRTVTPELLARLGGLHVCNSSIMLWNGHDPGPQRVWTEFDPRVMKTLAGDQNWTSQVLREDGLCLLGEDWAGSYRYHYRKGLRRPITIFHGHPKPGDLADAEVLRDWL